MLPCLFTQLFGSVCLQSIPPFSYLSHHVPHVILPFEHCAVEPANTGRSRRSPSSISVGTVLLLAPRHDPERGVGKRPLQRERVFRRCGEPLLDFLAGRQDRRHRLGMDRRDDSVRLRRQKAKRSFSVSPSLTLRTDFKRVQIPAKNVSGRRQGKPNRRPSRRASARSRKRRERKDAAALDAQPSSPVRRGDIAHVRDARCGAHDREHNHSPDARGVPVEFQTDGNPICNTS